MIYIYIYIYISYIYIWPEFLGQAKLHFLNNSSPKLAQSGAGRPFGSGCLVAKAHPSEPEHVFFPVKLPASPSLRFL